MSFFAKAALTLGGAFISEYFSRQAAADAANVIEGSTAASTEAINAALEQTRADTAAQREASQFALERLQGMATGEVGVEDIPGYQFRLDEGLQATERLASAEGRLLSGRTAKELFRYGSGHAASEYGNEWSRLAQLAGLGAPGVSTTINAGVGAGTNLANLYGQQGVNQANLISANNQGLTSTIQNVVAAFTRSSLLNNVPAQPEG